jgi:hypothetical protein
MGCDVYMKVWCIAWMDKVYATTERKVLRKIYGTTGGARLGKVGHCVLHCWWVASWLCFGEVTWFGGNATTPILSLSIAFPGCCT